MPCYSIDAPIDLNVEVDLQENGVYPFETGICVLHLGGNCMKIIQQMQNIALVIFMGLLSVWYLPAFEGPDMSSWTRYAGLMMDYGWIKGYEAGATVHTPLLHVFLASATWLGSWAGIDDVYSIQISLLLFLFLTVGCIYRLSGNNIEMTFCFYLMLWLLSIPLSYVDIYVAPFILLSIYSITKVKNFCAVILFSIAAMIKCAPLIIAPFFLGYLFVVISARQPWVFARYVISGLVVVIPLCLVFRDGLLLSLFKALHQQQIPTANALNLHWVIGYFDGVEYGSDAVKMSALSLNSKLLFLFFYLSALFVFLAKGENPKDLLLFAIIGYMAYFITSIGVHENHLFLASLLAMALACIDSTFLVFAIVIGIMSTFNIYIFYFYGKDMDNLPLIRVSMAIFNVAYFVGLWAVTVIGKLLPGQLRTQTL